MVDILLNEKFTGAPKLKCNKCGYVQEYHELKKQCPNCGRRYDDFY